MHREKKERKKEIVMGKPYDMYTFYSFIYTSSYSLVRNKFPNKHLELNEIIFEEYFMKN